MSLCEYEKKEDAKGIKQAILINAQHQNCRLEDLANDLIAAFEKVNKHYETEHTAHIDRITFNVIKGA